MAAIAQVFVDGKEYPFRQGVTPLPPPTRRGDTQYCGLRVLLVSSQYSRILTQDLRQRVEQSYEITVQILARDGLPHIPRRAASGRRRVTSLALIIVNDEGAVGLHRVGIVTERGTPCLAISTALKAQITASDGELMLHPGTPYHAASGFTEFARVWGKAREVAFALAREIGVTPPSTYTPEDFSLPHGLVANEGVVIWFDATAGCGNAILGDERRVFFRVEYATLAAEAPPIFLRPGALIIVTGLVQNTRTGDGQSPWIATSFRTL